jgi:hypothetical protein
MHRPVMLLCTVAYRQWWGDAGPNEGRPVTTAVLMAAQHAAGQSAPPTAAARAARANTLAKTLMEEKTRVGAAQ